MMKIATVLSLSMTLFFSSCGHPDKSRIVNTAVDADVEMIEVIDFYGTHRCVTCKAIEANAEYTVETYFADEQKHGTVVFKTVNVDEEANYDMAEKFEATGTALFLNVINDGQESHIDLTDFAFAKGNDQETFSKELKAKIETELKQL